MATSEIEQGFQIPCGYTNFELEPSTSGGLVFRRLVEAMEIDEDSPIKAAERAKPNVIYSGPAPIASMGSYGTARSGSTSTKLTVTGSQLGQGASKQTSQSGPAYTSNTDGPDEGSGHANSSHGKGSLDLGHDIKKIVPESLHTAKKNNGEQIQFPPELLLMRPARQRIEMFQRPYTRKRFMEVVRMLYRVAPSEKPLFYLAAVDVTDPSKNAGFLVGEGVSVEEWDDQLTGLIPHIKGPRSMIRVVKLFSSLTLRDGRNTLRHKSIDVTSSSVANRVAGLTGEFIHGTGIQTAFNKALTELMASGPEPVAVKRAVLQVARYQGEWLDWYVDMSFNDFLSKLLWKVDDPVINIYPSDWIPELLFEESLAEGESLEDVSFHREAQKAAEAAEKFLNDVENLLGYDRGTLRDRSHATGELINLFWAEHVFQQGHTAMQDKQSSSNATGRNPPFRAQHIISKAGPDISLFRELSNIRHQAQQLRQRQHELEAKEAAFERLVEREDAAIMKESLRRRLAYIEEHEQYLDEKTKRLEEREQQVRQEQIRLEARAHALKALLLEPSGGANCPHPGCSAKFDAPAQNHIGRESDNPVRCSYNGCHAALNLLSEPEKAEHEDLHVQAQAAANRANDILENGQELIIDTEGFSEAQLGLVGRLREALHETQKLQLEKQTLETGIRSERREAEVLVHRIALQHRELELLRASAGSTGIVTSSQAPGVEDEGIKTAEEPNAVPLDEPTHAQGSKGTQTKAALPKCPDGTKRYCPVCLLNIHTFGVARTRGHFAKHPEHNLTVPDSIRYLKPKQLALEKKRQK